MTDGGALRRGLSPGKHRMERLLSWAWSNRVEIGIVWGVWFIWGKLAELMPAPLALVVMLAAAGGVYLCAPAVSLWKPIPVGVAEDGTQVTVSLVERNLLLGGEPGGGKSVALQQVI